MQKVLSLAIWLIIFSCRVYADTHELIRPGVYDEEGKCIEPALYIVHPHEFTMSDYRDRPDLAGQGMPKKKKKSAWKIFIEDNPKKYCDEEDVRECEAWHKNKNERVERCERLLKESWGEDALQWAKWAVLIKYETRMAVQFVGMMGGPAGAVGVTVSELYWGTQEENFASIEQEAATQASNIALKDRAVGLHNKSVELGNKGAGGGLDSTIKRYGPGKAGNFHNAKIDATYNEAVATKAQINDVFKQNAARHKVGKALPYISMGTITMEYGNDLAKLEDLEKQHGEAYSRCVEAISDLKNCICPVCGSM